MNCDGRANPVSLTCLFQALRFAPLIDQKIFHYRILSMLGGGGMGVEIPIYKQAKAEYAKLQ